MAGNSVAALQLSSNQVFSLAEIIEINLKYYCAHSSPLEKNYQQSIKTIVGLGFTAALVNENFLNPYILHLDTFLKYQDFKKHQHSLPELSLSIAELIDIATVSFSNLEHANYHQDFIVHLDRALDNAVSMMAGKQKEAKELVNVIARDRLIL